MIERIRFTWQLLVLASFLVLAGILLLTRIQADISSTEYLVTLVSVLAINFITYLLMHAGITKGSKNGVVFMLAGIGVKFLLYLVFILLSLFALKNLSKAFIISFFALYLIFTFFTAAHLFKTLKNN